jgi:ammonium transporter, Amt family
MPLTVKFLIGIDDSLDVFAEHGVGGMVGLIFNGFFAADYIIGLDGVSTGIINGGFLNHNYRQLYVQIAYLVAVTAYTFTMSAILAKAIDLIPGLHLRASEEAELLGMDDDQHGEFAYDYVEVRRDYLAWTPAEKDPKEDGAKIVPQHGIEEHQNLMLSQSNAAGPQAQEGIDPNEKGDRDSSSREKQAPGNSGGLQDL